MSARKPETTATAAQAAERKQATAGGDREPARSDAEPARSDAPVAATGLERFRSRLDELDEQIARLFGERFAICREIALYKCAHDIPMMQPQRVREVRARYLARGAEVDLPLEFTAELFELLIDATCSMEEDLIDAAYAAGGDPIVAPPAVEDKPIAAPPAAPDGPAL